MAPTETLKKRDTILIRHMKKILILGLAIMAIISSCKKEDDPVFEKSADERLKEKLDAYQAQLSGAQNGWKGALRTAGGNGSVFNFYFKFTDANRVTMLSDFDGTSSTVFRAVTG